MNYNYSNNYNNNNYDDGRLKENIINKDIVGTF
jgi:hypothetical protein